MMSTAMIKQYSPGCRRGARSGALLVAATVALSACDLEVTNPGMIEDLDLNNPAAIPAMVAGVAGDFAYSAVVPGGGGVYNAGAMLTDELVHVGTWVGLRGLSDGESRDDWAESQSRWAEPARARWTAEHAIERISDLVETPRADPNVAHATLWAGFTNRLLGDNFCQAVINGGPLEPHTKFFERAERHFTDVIEIATAADRNDFVTAAYAGRAQTRMMLAGLGVAGYTWDMAVEDAARVPTSYVFWQRHSENSSRENNDFYWWGNLRNETSLWGTPFAEWGQDLSVAGSTGDPRVQYWSLNPTTNRAQNGGDGRRPFWRQAKFRSYGDDIAVARGTEMRLIEGEAALVNGDWETAIAKINEVRQFNNTSKGFSLPMVSASNVDETWPLLMRERGLEMWLEGRRLPDMRRWSQVPGKDKVPFLVIREANLAGAASTDPKRPVANVPEMCIQVSQNEKLSNPNI